MDAVSAGLTPVLDGCGVCRFNSSPGGGAVSAGLTPVLEVYMSWQAKTDNSRERVRQYRTHFTCAVGGHLGSCCQLKYKHVIAYAVTDCCKHVYSEVPENVLEVIYVISVAFIVLMYWHHHDTIPEQQVMALPRVPSSHFPNLHMNIYNLWLGWNINFTILFTYNVSI